MLTIVDSVNDEWIKFIRDDPVRPEISVDFRVSVNRFIVVLTSNEKLSSIVCVSLHDRVPASVQDLYDTAINPMIAVMYTIWSYESGAGSRLVEELLEYISKNMRYIDRCVTLSPKTEMARKFHTKNGAFVFRENSDTVNYEYLLTRE